MIQGYSPADYVFSVIGVGFLSDQLARSLMFDRVGRFLGTVVLNRNEAYWTTSLSHHYNMPKYSNGILQHIRNSDPERIESHTISLQRQEGKDCAQNGYRGPTQYAEYARKGI